MLRQVDALMQRTSPRRVGVPDSENSINSQVIGGTVSPTLDYGRWSRKNLGISGSTGEECSLVMIPEEGAGVQAGMELAASSW